MAKTSKGMILSQTDQLQNDYDFVLIQANSTSAKELLQAAQQKGITADALVDYQEKNNNQWTAKGLTTLGFQAGCFLIVDIRNTKAKAVDLAKDLAAVRQYGYQVGIIANLNTLTDIKSFKNNQFYLINSGREKDDEDATLNGDMINDLHGKLAVGMSVKWQRDYTNVDVTEDNAGYVGMGVDTLLSGGKGFGYSTNGRDFNIVITPKGLIFRRADAERMWRLLRPKEIADIDSTVNNRVDKEVKSAQAGISSAVAIADSAASTANSAVAASKVNSDAINAMSSAISAAKSGADQAIKDATSAIASVDSKANAIKSDVADVESQVSAAKSANAASVEQLQSDISATSQDLTAVHDNLAKAQSAVEQNQKLINSSVTQINNQIANDRKSMEDTRNQLKSAQQAIDGNRQALNSDVAVINGNVDQNRKDIQALQQANADTAKQLDNYTKEAQAQGKTIKDLQSNADSTKLTIADIKGNVSQVQDSVTGLTANLKDTNDNVTAVKALADQLSTTMTDHGKNIASLQATAKQLSSTLSDADGRLSAVEQTAKANTSTLSTVKGDLSQVKQTAEGLSTTLSDTQKSISQVQQTAQGLSDQVTNVQGDISKLQTTVTGIQATVSNHDKNIHTLQADSKSLKDDMADAKGNISSLQKTASDMKSSIEDADGRLSTVEQTAREHTSTLSQIEAKTEWKEIDTKTDMNTLTTQQNVFLKSPTNQPPGDYWWYVRVVPGTDKRVTQYAVSDRDNKHYTRQFGDDGWAAWTKTADQGDVNGLQSNISQVKQTADSLTATLKNAQSNITQVQATAKGLTTQISNAQSDITNLQADVKGIKATLTDHDNNIHTLQADAKSLQDDMTDAKGNISSLQKTSTKLASEMTDHNGRISKAEQTATKLTNELSDADGRLSAVEQTANGTKQTVTNQQGEIDTIKTDAQGMHQTLTGQNNQIATINTTLTGLNTKYESVETGLNNVKEQTDWKTVTGALDANKYTTTQRIFYKDTQAKNTPDVGWFYLAVDAPTNYRVTQTLTKDTSSNTWTRKLTNDQWTDWVKQANQNDINDLSGRITTNATAIDQNKKEIALSAKQSTVDNLSKQVSQDSAQLKVQAGQISAKADSTTVSGLTNTVNNLKNTTEWHVINTPTDFNNLKTQQSVFITGTTTHQPPGTYWWYLRVVPGQGGDSGRITQYAVSDRDDKHFSRQFISPDWTEWKEEANQADVTNLQAVVQKNSTEITNNSKAIQLKADKSTTDALNKSYSDQQATLKTLAGEIQSKVTSADVQGILKNGKYATEDYTQSIVDQTSKSLNSTITEVKRDMINGQNDVANKISNITQSIDGIQTTVGNKADKSTVTQLANAIQLKLDGRSLCSPVKDQPQWTGKTNEFLPIANLQGINDVKKGTTVTLSFNYVSSSDVTLLPQFNNDPWIPFGDINTGAVQGKPGELRTYSKTITVNDDSWEKSNATQLCIRCDGFKGTIAITELSLMVNGVSSEIDMLGNDVNLRVKKGDVVSQINQEAGGNTLIQVANGKGKLYLDADSTVFSGKAFIPSAAITNLDADKITAGYIKVPMSDGNGNTIQIGNGGIDLVSVDTSAKIFNANRGYARVNINAGGMSFEDTTNGQHEVLGAFSPLDDETSLESFRGNVHTANDINGIGFVVETKQEYGTPYGGDFFSLARSIRKSPSYYNGFIYNASGQGRETGSHFFDPIFIHPYGADNYIESGWISWSNWDNGEKYPALVQQGINAGGICFPKSGKVTLFDAAGHAFWPTQYQGKYNRYEFGDYATDDVIS